MKLRNISIYALTMAAGMGLWSCTSDEALSGGEAYGEPIPVTITLSRGDAQTRTELSENAEGGLDDKWLRNDQLVVINSNNEEVGVLKFVKYVDDLKPNEAVFQGTLEGVADGVYDYTLWYLGGNGTQQTSLSVFANDYETDGGYPMLVKTTLTQQTGKFDDLVRGDLLSKQIKIRVSDHKAAVEHSLDAASRTMTAHLAMASIKLDGVDGVTDGTLKISHAPSNIDPWYDVYFNRVTSNTRAKVSAVDHPLIINGVNTSSPVYIVLNPAQYSGDTALVLTLTSGDKTWTATLPDIPMEAGKYYRNGADGNQFSVTMIEEQKAELHLYANFTGANPEKIVISKPFVDGSATYDLTKSYADEFYTGDNGNKLPSAPAGYSFLGWSTSSESTTPDCDNLTLYNNKDGRIGTVYAVWSFVDDSDNPGNMNNWGGNHGNLGGIPSFVNAGNNDNDAWVSNTRSFQPFGYKKTSDYRYNAMKNGHLISWDYGNEVEAKYFQWGRLLGFPKDVVYAQCTMLSYVYDSSKAKYPFGMNQYTDYQLYYCWDMDSRPTYVHSTAWSSGMTPQQAVNSSIVFILGDGVDYLKSSYRGYSWDQRSGNPCPDGYRVPTKTELEAFVPSKSFNNSSIEAKEIDGVRYVIRWRRISDKKVGVASVRSDLDVSSVNDAIFNNVTELILETSGIIYMEDGDAAYYPQLINGENVGYYWSSTLEKIDGKYFGWALRVGIKGSVVTINMEEMEPVVGCGILPFKDDNARATGFQPWFPKGY